MATVDGIQSPGNRHCMTWTPRGPRRLAAQGPSGRVRQEQCPSQSEWAAKEGTMLLADPRLDTRCPPAPVLTIHRPRRPLSDVHGLSRTWARLGRESGRGHGPQDDGGAGCVFRGPTPAPGRWCPEGLRLDPGRTRVAPRGAASACMEAIGPVLRLGVCTPVTGPPDKGRTGSWWRADVS